MNGKNLIFLFALVVSAIIACKPSSESNPSSLVDNVKDTLPINVPEKAPDFRTSPPIAGVDTPLRRFNINTHKNEEITIESGTRIRVPKYCFNLPSGETAKGTITLLYRELHSIADLILSGINLKYDGGDFESAGMFEIRAESGGQELTLKPNKSISVEMASYKKGDFEHYALDDETGQWTLIGNSKISPNTNKKKKLAKWDELKNSLEEPCDMQPAEYNNEDFVVDIERYGNGYELFRGAVWKLLGGADKKKEFLANQQLFNDMELYSTDDCQTFELSLTSVDRDNRKKSTKKYEVTPVWRGKELEKAKVGFTERMADFRRLEQEIKKNKMLAQKEADILRSFELNKMGIYNCDKVFKSLSYIAVAMVITCREKIKNWWYITNNKRVAINYFGATDVPDFKYLENSENEIVALLENGNVVTLNSRSFFNAYKSYQESNAPNKVLELNIPTGAPQKIENKENFENVIAGL